MDNFRIAAKSFIIKDGNLLIIKRRSNDVQKPGIWEIPGGRLELGEDPREGLKREVMEEVGIDIDISHPLNIRHFTREDGQIVTLLIFSSKAISDKIILSEEHSNFEWIPIENCKDKLNEFFHEEVDIFNEIKEKLVNKIKQFTATKAFIVFDGKILLLRESDKYEDGTNFGKYDVPGGRVNLGQRFDESLLREIKEETGLDVKIGKPFHVDEWKPVVKSEQWQITGIYFECFSESNEVNLSEDHDKCIWIDSKNYKNYNLIENLKPAFESYLNKWKMENQEKVWDEIASEWNRFRRKQMPEVTEFLKDKKGNITDLGCGSGRNLSNNSNLKFYGVDFSKEMIKLAKINAKEKQINAEFFTSPLNALPFEDNFFDAAIFVDTLHCIPENKKRKEALEELIRILKPKSKTIITVWSKNHAKLVNQPKNTTVTWKKNSENIYRYYYIYDKEELQKLLEDTGFKIISIKEDNKKINVTVKKP